MYEKAWRRPFTWAGDTRRHQFLYDLQAALKVLAAIAFGATLLAAFQGWPGAFFLAGAFVLLWLLWVVAALAEHHARKGLAGPVTEADSHERRAQERERIEREVLRAEVRLGLEILAGLVLVAIVLAVLLPGRQMGALGVLLAFAYLTLFGAPYWIAALHERADEERERLSR